jgi:hypothetical protein
MFLKIVHPVPILVDLFEKYVCNGSLGKRAVCCCSATRRPVVFTVHLGSQETRKFANVSTLERKPIMAENKFSAVSQRGIEYQIFASQPGVSAMQKSHAYQQAAHLWYTFIEYTIRNPTRGSSNHQLLKAIELGSEAHRRASAASEGKGSLRGDRLGGEYDLERFRGRLSGDLQHRSEQCEWVMARYDPQKDLSRLSDLLLQSSKQKPFGEVYLQQLFEEHRCNETGHILMGLLGSQHGAPTAAPERFAPGQSSRWEKEVANMCEGSCISSKGTLWSIDVCTNIGFAFTLHRLSFVRIPPTRGSRSEAEFWLVQSYYSRLCKESRYTFSKTVQPDHKRKIRIKKSVEETKEYLFNLYKLLEMADKDLQEPTVSRKFIGLWEQLFLLPSRQLDTDARDWLLSLPRPFWWWQHTCWLSLHQIYFEI